jgi:hypothetical protein
VSRITNASHGTPCKHRMASTRFVPISSFPSLEKAAQAAGGVAATDEPLPTTTARAPDGRVRLDATG